MADISFDGLEFNYGPGNADWYVQSSVYHTPPDALRAGTITHNQTSRIDLVNPGTGDLTFWWRTSSESNYDYLEFYINDIRQERISGTSSTWVQKTYAIDSGDTVYWVYDKDGSVSTGLDTGFLDTFSFVAASSSSTSFSSSSVSFSSSSRSSSSSSSSISVTPTITTNVEYPLATDPSPFLFTGPDADGLWTSGNGRWNRRTTPTGSSGTGPSVPPPGPDSWYWYCETSGTSLGEVFTMTLELNLDASRYNYIIDFFYSNYGSTGGGECLVQFHNGTEWVTVQTIGWDTSSSAWKAATPIDLSSFDNEYGQLRWHFTTGGGTTYRNDFALDWITITTETASSSSSSVSSSSSSISSSTSLSSGTWTWGQQTGVPTDYALTFANGRITPWDADEIEGSGDNERIIANADGSYIWSEPANIGADSNVHLEYNKYSGSREDSRFGAILFRTGATRQACLATGWQNYDRNVPMNCLGWIQISFTINSLSSSSVSSSSSSSASLDCQWQSLNGGLSDWDIAQDEGVNLAAWSGSVWTSILHHLDEDISGDEEGVASYVYLIPKVDIDFKMLYTRVTHNRTISDIGGDNPKLQDLASNSSLIVDEDQYLSDTIVPTSFGPAGNVALFKFYHTGATPYQISNIEYCRSSSSSSTSSSSSVSSSCPLGYYETMGPSFWPSVDGVWDGSGYTAVSNGDWVVSLLPAAGPLSGSQPVHIKITLNNFIGWDPNGFIIIVEDTDSNEVYNSGEFDLDGDGVPTTKSFSPTWGSFPLYFIRIDGGDDKFYVSDVQIYEDCGTESFSSSSVSSSSSSSSVSSSSFSLTPVAIEDLTTYSLFQTGPSYLTVNTWPGPISRCTWSGLTVNAESVCYKMPGPPHSIPENFTIDFEFSMSQHVNIANNDTLMLCCVTGTPGTYTEQVAANDGIMYLIHSGPVQECSVRLTCGINSNSSVMPISGAALPVGTIYARLRRFGTTATAYAWSDAARTVLINSTSIVVPTTTFSWFVPTASIEGIGAYWTTGLAQQFQLYI